MRISFDSDVNVILSLGSIVKLPVEERRDNSLNQMVIHKKIDLFLYSRRCSIVPEITAFLIPVCKQILDYEIYE